MEKLRVRILELISSSEEFLSFDDLCGKLPHDKIKLESAVLMLKEDGLVKDVKGKRMRITSWGDTKLRQKRKSERMGFRVRSSQ